MEQTNETANTQTAQTKPAPKKNRGGRPRMIHPSKVKDLLAVVAVLTHYADSGEIPDGSLIEWAKGIHKAAMAGARG